MITPALSASSPDCGRFSAYPFVFSREIVTGMPPVPIVKNTANSESATWYKPNPSAPINLARAMRYKNPSVLSIAERAVITNVVLYTLRRIQYFTGTIVVL